MTITGSTFSNNSARNGGGLGTNGGTADLTNSTFFHNNAQIRGGGVFNDQSSTMSVTNSTFSDNSAPSGGGGVYNSAAITLRNTIVANSLSGRNCGGTINNGGGNLDSETTCGWGSTGGSLSNTDPMLGPLTDNGGPTQTMALLSGSPAIGKGIIAYCPTTDQRGVARPPGTFCDMGAYESYSIVVNSTADTIADDGLCTLREAIMAANNNAAQGGCPAGSATSTDSIRISVTDPITLAGSQLPAVASPIIITGAGPEETIIQANANPNVATYRVFEVGLSIGDLTLNQLTVRHGRCNGSCETTVNSGGGVLNVGLLTVLNSTISANSAVGGGAGIYSAGWATVVTNSTISNNTGNGIWNVFPTQLTVTNSTISGNTSTGYGGGILNYYSATVANSTIANNSGLWGAGISVSGVLSSLSLKNTIVANNTGGSNCFTGMFEGPITNDGGNLSWPDTTCPGLNANPDLGPLANNGGPTQTMALRGGSPAINAGLAANCQATDQRGVTRPQPEGSQCDIGAYEFVPRTISGNAGVAGATLSYVEITPRTVTANGGGNYSITVPDGWSGTITPSLNVDAFCPTSLTYTNLMTNKTLQHFAHAPCPNFGSINKWSPSFDLGHGWTVQDYVRTVGDVSGDGRVDLVGFGQDGVYIAVSNGTGFNAASKWVTAFDLAHGWTVKDFVRTVGDVNGDGKDDLVGFGQDGVYVSISTGSSFPTPSKWVTAFDLAHGWTVNDYVRTVGDVNGDGQDDLVGFGLDGVYVSLSTGSSFPTPSKWVTAFDLAHGWTVSDFVRTVGDVNGDGRDDLVGFGLDGVYVSLSTGSSFPTPSKWTNSFALANGWTVSDYVRTVGDVNRDGKADIVGFGLDGVYISLSQ